MKEKYLKGAITHQKLNELIFNSTKDKIVLSITKPMLVKAPPPEPMAASTSSAKDPRAAALLAREAISPETPYIEPPETLMEKFYNIGLVSFVSHQIRKVKTKLQEGTTCCEVSEGYVTMAKRILPVLKSFQINNIGWPGHISRGRWNKIIAEMIWAFEFILREEESCNPYNEADQKRCNDGLKLFGKWFRHIWI